MLMLRGLITFQVAPKCGMFSGLRFTGRKVSICALLVEPYGALEGGTIFALHAATVGAPIRLQYACGLRKYNISVAHVPATSVVIFLKMRLRLVIRE